MDIAGTSFSYSDSRKTELGKIAQRVGKMRRAGDLRQDALVRIRKFFRIKNIYHSNAIEGNKLDIGETRLVVERGLTITGKSLKDQAEAKNLSEALDYLEEMIKQKDNPISEVDIRQIHNLVLRGIDDENAGAYRTVEVEISGSEFHPSGPENIATEMEEFGKWLKNATSGGNDAAESNVIITAAVAHTWFVITHPFVDGNGRVARLLLNLILMRSGFPPAIITKEDRQRYYDSLEAAQSSDLTPFISLLTECISESLEEYEAAAKEQKDFQDAVDSIVKKLAPAGEHILRGEFEVWRNAMELLKSYFSQMANELHNRGPMLTVKFRDFNALEYEKYVFLRNGKAAKKTWFFRIDFMLEERTARYLFFFGFASSALRGKCKVTLHVLREDPPGSWNYERLGGISSPNVPDVHEIGYIPEAEKFISKGKSRPKQDKIDAIGKKFFEEVIEKHFSNL